MKTFPVIKALISTSDRLIQSVEFTLKDGRKMTSKTYAASSRPSGRRIIVFYGSDAVVDSGDQYDLDNALNAAGHKLADLEGVDYWTGKPKEPEQAFGEPFHTDAMHSRTVRA